MKAIKENTKDHTKLHLQEMETTQVAYPADFQSATDLEFIMTKSAFGYEYALESLERADVYDMNSEQVLVEVDTFKKSYFLARNKLKKIDNDRLTKLEEELRVQKLAVFGVKQTYLH